MIATASPRWRASSHALGPGPGDPAPGIRLPSRWGATSARWCRRSRGGAIAAEARRGEFRSNLHRGGFGTAGGASCRLRRGRPCARPGWWASTSREWTCSSPRRPQGGGAEPSPGFEGLERATGLDIAGEIVAFAAQVADGARRAMALCRAASARIHIAHSLAASPTCRESAADQASERALDSRVCGRQKTFLLRLRPGVRMEAWRSDGPGRGLQRLHWATDVRPRWIVVAVPRRACTWCYVADARLSTSRRSEDCFRWKLSRIRCVRTTRSRTKAALRAGRAITGWLGREQEGKGVKPDLWTGQDPPASSVPAGGARGRAPQGADPQRELLKAMPKRGVHPGHHVSRRTSSSSWHRGWTRLRRFVEQLDDPGSSWTETTRSRREALGSVGVPAPGDRGEWLMQGCRELAEYRHVIDKVPARAGRLRPTPRHALARPAARLRARLRRAGRAAGRGLHHTQFEVAKPDVGPSCHRGHPHKLARGIAYVSPSGLRLCSRRHGTRPASLIILAGLAVFAWILVLPRAALFFGAGRALGRPGDAHGEAAASTESARGGCHQARSAGGRRHIWIFLAFIVAHSDAHFIRARYDRASTCRSSLTRIGQGSSTSG